MNFKSDFYVTPEGILVPNVMGDLLIHTEIIGVYNLPEGVALMGNGLIFDISEPCEE